MIAHHHIRQRVPMFRKVVAGMANMADGDVTAFDEATVEFMAKSPEHFHQKAIDRLLGLWFRHYRREVIRRGDEKAIHRGSGQAGPVGRGIDRRSAARNGSRSGADGRYFGDTVPD
jgi:hypothetical protein